eukprot:scaffold10470_cov124-Isochrysis_galbana.AAC.4
MQSAMAGGERRETLKHKLSMHRDGAGRDDGTTVGKAPASRPPPQPTRRLQRAAKTPTRGSCS